MPSARRDLISDLYHRALARAPEERIAFLAEACDGDESLREEVVSLLEFEPASARLLERPAVAVAAVGASGTSMIDRRIGPYTIVAPLGAGGMGEVYRARDSKLGRDVAIKILPAHFTADSERRARFAREARTLATLNHPHIGAIYGLEEADGLTALVLELVEGQTLADRLERGPLPLALALTIARQIAGALEAAHEKGIVHRDLKPANVVLQGSLDRLSSEVRARVLDFGLAKPMMLDSAAPTQAPSDSFDGTADGRILGTPAYMSPEQARGQDVDRRTDIWAFGCVLFEMLAGRRAFHGDTISDTFVSVLERDPDWDALPRDTPAAVRTLLRRCLRKDPQKRLHDIADAVLDIDDAITTPRDVADAGARPDRGRSVRAVLPWLVAVALGGALAWVGWRDYRASTASSASPAEAAQLTIHSLEGGANSVFQMSPDGRYLAFAPILTGRPMLWVYWIATGETTALAGTEGARHSFWKFDSQEIAFFAGDQLKTVSLRGGLPVKIATVDSNVAGGTWGRNNVIVVTKLRDALQRVRADGTFEAVTALRQGESVHAAPAFLPDGVHFLYLAVSDGGKSRELRVGSLESKEMIESLGPVESNALYADGHLFFVRGGHAGGGSLTVRPFDPVRRQATGDAVALGLTAAVYAQVPSGAFSVSEAGRLVYLPTTAVQFDLTWHNRAGDRMGTVGPPGRYHHLDISPDDQKVAFSRQIQDPGKPMEMDIWTIDLAGGGAHRVTRNPAYEADPAFSGDSRMLAFNSNQPDPFAGKWRLWVRPSDGSGTEVPLADPVRVIASPDWSLDGKHIVYEDDGDLWTVPASGGVKPSNFVKTPDDEETDPAFSRDGRWIAYTSDKSGRPEVYVQAFRGAETAHPVSRGGGWAPRWSGDGKELFFLTLDSMVMAAPIDPATGMTTGVPRSLFATGVRRGWQKRPYDVTTDAQRFLVPTMRPPEPFRVVMNWRALLPHLRQGYGGPAK